MRRDKTVEGFNYVREGCYGVFATNHGPRVEFVQTTFGLTDLGLLSTVKESFSEAQTFEEMIQRDIHQPWVDSIVEYLLRQQEMRFLPPMLAALVGVESDAIGDAYPEPTWQQDGDIEKDEGTLVRTWPGLFQLKHVLAPSTFGGSTIQLKSRDGREYRTYPWMCSVLLNTRKAKLIVVDGQHRLSALKQIVATGRGSELGELRQPVCVFFASFVNMHSLQRGINVSGVLRKLFVDVNFNAKRVSGHWIVLLRDDNLAAFAIRAYCELLRSQGYLWLTEWSQHEDKFAYQVNEPHALSGVGVLFYALLDPGIHDKRKTLKRMLTYLFHLDDVKDELEAARERWSFAQIDWDAFDFPQVGLLKKQIDKYVVPVLEALFGELHPFREGRKIALAQLNASLADETDAKLVAHVRNAILASQRVTVTAAESVEDRVKKDIGKKYRDQKQYSYVLYRTQRYQQSLLHTFYTLAEVVLDGDFDVDTVSLAKALVAVLNAHQFKGKDVLLGGGNVQWLEGVIMDSAGRIIARKRTRVEFANLTLALFGSKSVAKAFVEASGCPRESADAMIKALQAMGEERADAYWSAYTRAAFRLLEKGFLNDPAIDEEDVAELVELKTAAEGKRGARRKREEAALELEQRLRGILQPRTERVRAALEKVLGYELPASATEVEDEGEDDGEEED